MQFSLIQQICIWALPVLFAITVHEVAHGYVALKCGDTTAKMLGRLTLNPAKHIDLIGTVIVPLALLFFTHFIFGWAKPIPINARNLKNIRMMALVALAGPLANLIMAILWGLIEKLGLYLSMHWGPVAAAIIYMGQAGIMINLILFLINIIPIPPLDGGRVLSSILPPKIAFHYDRIEPFGFIIILVLLVTGILTSVLMPIFFLLHRLIALMLGLPF